MKAVVIGESSGVSMEAIMAVFPRHKAVVDKFVSRGVVLGIGPFTFILEGLVKSVVIKDWRDSLLPE